MSTVFDRFDKNLSLSVYGTQTDTIKSLDLGEQLIKTPVDRQYILRMALRFAGSELMIPPELEWMHETIMKCYEFQKAHFIESDDNTQNPLLPVAPFNRADIRDKMINY